MTATIQDFEPISFIAGDTVKWKKILSDYPALDGWVLTYALLGSGGQINITGSNDGTNHTITIPSATSVNYTAGEYAYQAYITKGLERYLIASGTIEIKPNFATAIASDQRSHIKKVLDAINAVIEGRASQYDTSYSIAGRSISKMSLQELMEARRQYNKLYAQQLMKEKRKRGLVASPVRQHLQLVCEV